MEPEKKHRPSGRWLVVLPLLVVAVGLIAVVGIWRLRRGSGEQAVAQGPAPPIAPELPAPPPAWKAEFAPTRQGARPDETSIGFETTAKAIGATVSLLGGALQNIPVEPTAPASLLVLPGDVRTVDAISRIPRHERWEIQFPPGNTIDSYARQLDFFKIELGIIGNGEKVVYLSNVSAPTPTARSEPASLERRLYLVWRRGAMREAAEELASRAKIDSRGKVLVHFCPPELESQLVKLEDDYARQKGFRKIRKTVFGIKPNDSGGYACYVSDQKADQ